MGDLLFSVGLEDECLDDRGLEEERRASSVDRLEECFLEAADARSRLDARRESLSNAAMEEDLFRVDDEARGARLLDPR